jgi:diphthamide biosynthesis methyltransferase
MTANEGLEVLIRMEKKCKQHLFSKDSIACVVARAGAPDVVVAANTIEVLQTMDFGPPLHTVVIPGNLHFMEREALELIAGLPTDIVKKLPKL